MENSRTWNRKSRNPAIKSQSPGSRNEARGADSAQSPEAGSLHRGTGQSDVGPWRGRVPVASAEPRRRRRCRGTWCTASARGTRNAAQPGAQRPGAFWRHGGPGGRRLPPHGPRGPRGAVPATWHVTRKQDAHGWLAGGTSSWLPIWHSCSASTWHATYHDGSIPKTPACASGPAPNACPAPRAKKEEDGR